MDIYDAISPLYICTNLLGLSPYGFSREKNNRRYVQSFYSFYYTSILLVSFLVFYYYVIVRRTSFVTLEFNVITGVVDIFHIYGVSIVVLFIFVCNYYRRENVITALNTIHLVDQELMGLGYNLNHKLTKLLITCFLILIFCGMTGLEYINCNLFISSVRKYSLVCGVICTTSLTIMMIEEVQFFTYYSLLRNRFKAINDLLRTKFSNTDDTSNRQIHPVTIINCDKEVIMKLRSLHLQLCFVGRLLNEYFNIQILLLIGLSFLGFTTNAYYSFDVISDNFINDGNLIVPAAVFWVAAKFIELLVISVICTITKNEINQTGEILYQLKNRYKKSVATQINLFGKQILHCDFKITALDFFDIDMTLLYGIIGSAATYLTILIQFEIAAKESKRYINVTKN